MKPKACSHPTCEWVVDSECQFPYQQDWGCAYLPEVQAKIKSHNSIVDEFQNLQTDEEYIKFATKLISLNPCTKKELIGAHRWRITDYTNKVYNFVFKGHQYTLRESARDQSSCPNCDNHSSKPISPTTPNFEFIGIARNYGYILCFRCLKCNSHLFYHANYDFIKSLGLNPYDNTNTYG